MPVKTNLNRMYRQQGLRGDALQKQLETSRQQRNQGTLVLPQGGGPLRPDQAGRGIMPGEGPIKPPGVNPGGFPTGPFGPDRGFNRPPFPPKPAPGGYAGDVRILPLPGRQPQGPIPPPGTPRYGGGGGPIMGDDTPQRPLNTRAQVSDPNFMATRTANLNRRLGTGAITQEQYQNRLNRAQTNFQNFQKIQPIIGPGFKGDTPIRPMPGKPNTQGRPVNPGRGALNGARNAMGRTR